MLHFVKKKFERKKCFSGYLAASYLLGSTPVYADQNSPEVVIFSVIGFAAFAIFVFFVQAGSSKKAADSSNDEFADQSNLGDKLLRLLNEGVLYNVEIYRQSGNIERVEGPVSSDKVSSIVTNSMRRASISAVSISRQATGLNLRRVIYNGRGRQEGKRIGGYYITAAQKSVDFANGNASIQSEMASSKLEISISAKEEPEAAIVKIWFQIEDHFSKSDKKGIEKFLRGFDRETGTGAGKIAQTDFLKFLQFVDMALSGEAPINEIVRGELEVSKALHHIAIYNDKQRFNILGIETFEVAPSEIQKSYREWFGKLDQSILRGVTMPQTLTLKLSF